MASVEIRMAGVLRILDALVAMEDDIERNGMAYWQQRMITDCLEALEEIRGEVEPNVLLDEAIRGLEVAVDERRPH